MSAPAPQWFEWSGEGMMPLHPRAADRVYVVGERYHLEHREERSSASHARYFAAIGEAFDNLPAHIAANIVSPEHLRKLALIRAGYRDERSIVCSSKAEALKVAAFVRPLDEYAVVSVSGATVVVLTAKSQSMRAMPKGEFQKSKDAVLQVIAEMIGVSSETLRREGRAA